MKVIITIGELLAKGKLEQAEDVVPGFIANFSPSNLTEEVTLTEEQAQRLGLLASSQMPGLGPTHRIGESSDKIRFSI